MGAAYHLANVISIGLFLFYGVLCLFADGMVDEFERYGLSRFRRLTGALEVLGATGLVILDLALAVIPLDPLLKAQSNAQRDHLNKPWPEF